MPIHADSLKIGLNQDRSGNPQMQVHDDEDSQYFSKKPKEANRKSTSFPQQMCRTMMIPKPKMSPNEINKLVQSLLLVSDDIRNRGNGDLSGNASLSSYGRRVPLKITCIHRNHNIYIL